MAVLRGDARHLPLADGCVQCVVTSPPYWGLRDYGTAGQIGLEQTPDAYVAELVAVFREVRRVMRDDGVLWLNLGDSYNAYNGGAGPSSSLSRGAQTTERPQLPTGYGIKYKGLKPKDLVGIPWRVAFALQADGWYLRSDIIWHKPNPMPESVTDRPTKAHEMVFLLTKSDRYFYNAAAIAERVSETGVVASADGQRQGFVLGQDGGLQDTSAPFAAICVRLASTVLDIAQSQNDVGLFALDAEVGQQVPDGSAGFPVVQVPVVRRAAAQAARFADGDISAKEFLQQMHSLCVALPDGDDLKEAWRLAMLHISHIDANGDRSVAVNDAGKVSEIKRIHTFDYTARVPLSEKAKAREQGAGYYRPNGIAGTRGVGSPTTTRNARTVWTIATQPYSGAHFATFPEALVERCVLAGSRARDLVFDPFGGSGTTARVALRLGRRAVCTELNPAYIALAQERTHVTLGLPLEVA